ncbi:MAG: cation transporting ATPase C-terminal domain-containing protein, partial [Candidatus Helarchaeota archaeon]
DMTLADDNFASIVAAVKEGRIIYDNIKKFIFYIFSSNVGEILVVFLAVVFALGSVGGVVIPPLVAIHILTVNLVTDGLPGTALAFDPPTLGVMQKPPRDPDEPILTKRDLLNMSVVGIVITIGTLFAFLIGLNLGISKGLLSPELNSYVQTFSLLSLSFFQFFNVFLCREREKSIFKGPTINKFLIFSVLFSIVFLILILYIPGLATIFHLYPIRFTEWAIIILISATIIPIVEGFKALWNYIENPKRRKLQFYIERIDNIMKRYKD